MGELVVLQADDDGVDVLVGGTPVARYAVHSGLPATESPRPYLGRLRTRAGVAVSDFRPEDHPWHLDLSLALPYVGDTNLWGGRTWVEGAGEYVDLGNNGSMIHDALAVSPESTGFSESLCWIDAHGDTLARERRMLSFAAVSTGWRVDWCSSITCERSLSFGSPATHGRGGAGYGGIFLRAAPAFLGGTITTQEAQTELAESVLGVGADWMALSARDASATIAMAVPTPESWFVRTREYPGFGPAPFFHLEHRVRAGASVRFACSVLVADGLPSRTDLERDLLRVTRSAGTQPSRERKTTQ